MAYTFKGRTKVRPLSARKTQDTQQVLSQYGVTHYNPSWIEQYKEIWLEIGFGSGEQMCYLAAQNPDILYIGADVFQDGIAKACQHVIAHKLQNVRLFTDDAIDLLPQFSAQTLTRIYILHADPWPKKRHHKRRFINPDNINMICNILADKGELFVASDHADLVGWSLYHLNNTPTLEWTATNHIDWTTIYPNHIISRYGEKAASKDQAITYLHYVKNIE